MEFSEPTAGRLCQRTVPDGLSRCWRHDTYRSGAGRSSTL